MAKKKKKPVSVTARLARWRIWFQATFLVAWLDPLMWRMHGVCSPVFHCYSCPLALFACPIGVLANFSALHVMPYLALGTLLVVGSLVGSFICGWVCPFGFLQDLIGRIPTPKFRLPAYAGIVRYLVLAVFVLAIPYWYGEAHSLFFCRLCPAGALEAAVPNTVNTALQGESIAWPSRTKMVILGAFLAATLFTWRPWCTLFCPLGAIFGLANRFSFLYLRFHDERCTNCDLCKTACHYAPSPEARAGESRCVRCLECVHCRGLTVGTILDSGNKRIVGP